MDFIILIGPQAVGKMTVGLKLAEKTGLRLFHNHMSIELALKFFPYETPQAQHLISTIRREIFETMATSSEKGMIFTYVWAFNLESEFNYIQGLIDLFEKNGAQCYLVELEAPLETRIERNQTPLRLSEKASKRNVTWSQQELLNSFNHYRLNSNPGEISHVNYLRINNGTLEPEAVADQIIQHFNIDTNDLEKAKT